MGLLTEVLLTEYICSWKKMAINLVSYYSTTCKTLKEWKGYWVAELGIKKCFPSNLLRVVKIPVQLKNILRWIRKLILNCRHLPGMWKSWDCFSVWPNFCGALPKLSLKISCLENKGSHISLFCLTFPDFKLAGAKQRYLHGVLLLFSLWQLL